MLMRKLAVAAFSATSLIPLDAGAEEAAMRLDEIVVTPSGRGEELRTTASTVQVIDEEMIRNSPAQSLTGVLAENAAAFFSEWSAAQTSFNIRGGATDGQGRDYRSQVLVLINGRRAGTANLSKLSPKDVFRIEIIRGPASVVYGSQAMGGVINIITRNGENTTDSTVTAQGGSWGLVEGDAHATGMAGGFDLYAGAYGGRQGDYEAPSGTMENTSWQRYGGLASLGFTGERHNVDVILRSDGIYDAGFRGSQWDTDNTDDRYNQSAEAIWDVTATPWLNLSTHVYGFRDVDNFDWGSEVLRNGAPGYDEDNNRRTLSAVGSRFQPQVMVTPSTDLLLGLDLEYSWLRGDRYRIPMTGASPSQVAPYDINFDDFTLGVYGEGVQRLLDDRVALRAGLRYSFGSLSTVDTPNVPLLQEETRSFDDWTYSIGATFQATGWLSLRGGIATGFRAPTASELAADFTAVGGGQTLGNPNLKPESSLQYEVGAMVGTNALFLDLALFQNTISDRITTQRLNAQQSLYVNSPDDAVVQGLELQAAYDVAMALDLPWIVNLQANAVWNFKMTDEGADPALSGPYSDYIQRMYKYQASIVTTIGEADTWRLRLWSILRGPIYYDPEEALLIPAGEPNDRYVHRKDPFWVFNLRADWYPLEGVTLFAGINNIANKEEHPLFIATGDSSPLANPVSSNGGLGNSLPGRAFYVGMSYSF